MRGRVPPEELEYDPEIERTARRNNSKKKKKQELAKQRQQEGTSTVIPSLTTIPEPDTMAEIGQNPPEGNQYMNQSVMPCWTSPRRLAHLGKDKEKQVELKSGTIQLVSNHPFAGLDHALVGFVRLFWLFYALSVFYALANSLGASEADELVGFVRLFQHSLIGKAREWYLDQPPSIMNDWNALEKAFQERFFLDHRHMDTKTAIAMFAQGSDESLCEAWERYKSLLRKWLKHRFDDTTQTHMFRGGLLPEPNLILDAAAHGSLMALSPKDAVDIINKMSLND